MPIFTVTVAGENAKFWIAALVLDTGFPVAVAPPAPGAPVAIPDMPGIGVGVVPPPDPPPQAARPGSATARAATANSRRRGRRIVEEHHIG
ncbi:hypothetical protein [Candidatus Frankia alpina]|uniref:hypothetical protein n=1 Tax=Candidatus Frankia alpina TaxID=2699483 RepID=UPI001F2B1688|nr:hypothetical protein [Candidatus Frankia alpina]